VAAYEARTRGGRERPLLLRAAVGSDPVATAVANRLSRSACALAALPIAFSLAANGARSRQNERTFVPAPVRPPSYGDTVVAAWTSGILHMTLIQTFCNLARLITLTRVPRRILRVIITAVLVSSVSEGAVQQPSQDFTGGNNLFRGCKVLSEGGTADAQLQSAGMFCTGFAFGLASVGRYLSVPGLRSCAPATLTASQLASAIVKYAEAQPERMREDARQVTLEAFHDAWPCSN
jgi:hypothetical protein